MRERSYFDLIDLCYQGQEDAAHFQPLIERLVCELDAQAGDLVLERYDMGVAMALGTTGYDPHFREIYDTDFLGRNPMVEVLGPSPDCIATGGEAEPEGFIHSAYFNEWLAPQGLRHEGGAILRRDRKSVLHLSFSRGESRGPFFPAETPWLDRFLPHLCRAVTSGERLRSFAGEGEALSSLVSAMHSAAFVADSSGLILHHNQALDKLALREDSGFSIRQGRPELSDRLASRQLRDQFRNCTNIETLARSGPFTAIVAHRESGSPLILRLEPLRGMEAGHRNRSSCLVVVTDPVQPAEENYMLLQSAWNMTPTEAALVAALTGGKSVSAFAREAGMSAATARWHLRNVQAKMETNRIEEMVRLAQAALTRP